MGWDTWPHTREVMTWIISEASDKSCCSERSRWVVMMETLHLALRWITQSGSTWLIRLHSNDQPTRSSVAWTRGHVWGLTGGHRCQAAHQISRIWKGGGWVHVLARGPLSVGVNLRSGGKWIPLQCTRRHFHVWWRLEQKRFIAGESITAEVRRTVWKDKRTQQGFAFLWTALWTLGEATVLSHSLFVQIHIGEALKIPPSSLATCVGRGSSVAGFCSPTRPIITLQSTNSSR